MSCQHEDFHATVEVNRIHAAEDQPEPHAFVADVRIKCVGCGGRFGFKGLPAGASLDEPMASVDALEARLPLMSPAELELAGPFPAMRSV